MGRCDGGDYRSVAGGCHVELRGEEGGYFVTRIKNALFPPAI